MAGKREPKPGELKKIRVMIAAGARDLDVAAALAMSPGEFSKLRRRDPRVEKAYQAGKADEHKSLLDAANKIALSGESAQAAAMCKFLLQSRHGYAAGDNAPEEAGGILLLELPAPMTRAAYLQRLRVDPEAEPKAKTGGGPIARPRRA